MGFETASLLTAATRSRLAVLGLQVCVAMPSFLRALDQSSGLQACLESSFPAELFPKTSGVSHKRSAVTSFPRATLCLRGPWCQAW